MSRTKQVKPKQTTAQQLSALIKSARQILRKDKGLNGDADRLPLLTWVMFLKFLDDLEQRREEEADLGGSFRYIFGYALAAKIDVVGACCQVLERTCSAVRLILDTAEEIAGEIAGAKNQVEPVV